MAHLTPRGKADGAEGITSLIGQVCEGVLLCLVAFPRPFCWFVAAAWQDEVVEYEPDAKEFLQHVDKVVFVRRIPSWVSTEELGRQVRCDPIPLSRSCHS